MRLCRPGFLHTLLPAADLWLVSRVRRLTTTSCFVSRWSRNERNQARREQVKTYEIYDNLSRCTKAIKRAGNERYSAIGKVVPYAGIHGLSYLEGACGIRGQVWQDHQEESFRGCMV